jgi:hypothetical protein
MAVPLIVRTASILIHPSPVLHPLKWAHDDHRQVKTFRACLCQWVSVGTKTNYRHHAYLARL